MTQRPLRRRGSKLTTTSTLSQRTIQATIWAFGLRITDRVIRFVQLILVARLLTPGVIGVFAIALLVMALLNVFTHTGFEQALIQKREEIAGDLNSVWSVQILRGAILALAVFLAAPLVALFFRTPEVEAPMRVLALSPLLVGLTNVGVVQFERDLDFRRRYAYVVGADLAAFLAVAVAAASLRSVWALVIGLLIRDAATVILSYRLHSYRPHFQLDMLRLRRLGRFSRWVTGNRIVAYLANEGDDILLGRWLGAATLGLYQVGYRISSLVSTEITQVLGRATFPAYSRVQGELERLRRGYMIGLEATSALAFPVTAGILLLGAEFVEVFLGPQWVPMVPAMRVLAAAGLLRAISLTSASLNRAMGRPERQFWMILARLLAMGVVIYPLTVSRGMVGTAIAVLVGVTVMLPIWWITTTRALQGQRSDRLARMLPSLLGTLLMSIVVMPVLSAVGDDPITRLISGSLAGVLSYGLYHGALWLLWRIGIWRVVLALHRGLRTGNPGLTSEPTVH